MSSIVAAPPLPVLPWTCSLSRRLLLSPVLAARMFASESRQTLPRLPPARSGVRSFSRPCLSVHLLHGLALRHVSHIQAPSSRLELERPEPAATPTRYREVPPNSKPNTPQVPFKTPPINQKHETKTTKHLQTTTIMRSREQQSSRSLRGEGEGEGDEAPPPRLDHAHQHPNTSTGGCNRRAWCLLALLALLLLSTGSFLLRRTTQVTTTPTTTPQHLQNQQQQQHQLAPPPSDLVIHIILDGNVNGLATRHTSTAAFHRMHLCSVASACATARQYDTIINDGAQKARARLGVTPPPDPLQSFTRVRVYYDDEAPSAAAFANPEALIAQLAQETGCQEARLQARALRHAIPSLFFGLPLQGWYGTRAASNSRAAPTTALRHSSALPPQLQRNLQQVGGRSGGSSSQYDATLLTAVQIAIMLKLGGVLVTRDTILLRPSALALPNSLSFQVQCTLTQPCHSHSTTSSPPSPSRTNALT